MARYPYVIMQSAMSLDGCIDDSTPERLVLSNQADLVRVDELRASVDAILVGANTIRRDNPRLLVRSEELQRKRVSQGRSAHPIRVTITGSGNLDPSWNFFSLGESGRVVYVDQSRAHIARARYGTLAEIVPIDGVGNLTVLLADLYRRGVTRLLVEGGTTVNTMFLEHDLIDELCICVAPFFVGDKDAPKLVNPVSFPCNRYRRMQLESVEMIGDIARLRYLPGKSGDENARRK